MSNARNNKKSEKPRRRKGMNVGLQSLQSKRLKNKRRSKQMKMVNKWNQWSLRLPRRRLLKIQLILRSLQMVKLLRKEENLKKEKKIEQKKNQKQQRKFTNKKMVDNQCSIKPKQRQMKKIPIRQQKMKQSSKNHKLNHNTIMVSTMMKKSTRNKMPMIMMKSTLESRVKMTTVSSWLRQPNSIKMT